jgi:hypothetical protein
MLLGELIESLQSAGFLLPPTLLLGSKFTGLFGSLVRLKSFLLLAGEFRLTIQSPLFFGLSLFLFSPALGFLFFVLTSLLLSDQIASAYRLFFSEAVELALF